MIMGLSKSEIAKATATIIAPITIVNILDINFGNVAMQARTADKLKDKNISKNSISDDRTLIIKAITHYLTLFTFRS
jgi:hypothetical protein